MNIRHANFFKIPAVGCAVRTMVHKMHPTMRMLTIAVSLKYKRLNDAGFSMVEMMVGVALVAILLAVAAPNLNTWVVNNRTKAVAESLRDGLQQARAEAVKLNNRVEFTVYSSGTYLWRVSDVASTINFQGHRSEIGGDKVLITSNTNSVQFNGFGRAINLLTGPASFVVNVQSSVAQAPSLSSFVITVSQGGQVRMCDKRITRADDPRNCTGM